MMSGQQATFAAIKKVRATLKKVPDDTRKILEEEMRDVHKTVMDVELEVVDLRIQILNLKGQMEEATNALPEDTATYLKIKWENFNKTLLKDCIADDGSIRNVDDVEYERMQMLVEKMRPVNYTPPSVSVAAEVSGPSGAVPESANPIEKAPKKLACLQNLRSTKQSTLVVKTGPDGMKRLGFEASLSKDEGFESAAKRKKKRN